jgi:hypothetical protein
MPATVSVAQQVTIQSGTTYQIPVKLPTFSAVQSADGQQIGVQNVGTTKEAINLGDVVNAGLAFFSNLGPTNYVQIGHTVSGTFYPATAKLLPGETWTGRLDPSLTYEAKANVAAIELLYGILEA